MYFVLIGTEITKENLAAVFARTSYARRDISSEARRERTSKLSTKR